MPFQYPITIVDVLRKIQSQEFVLPAIQREFEWDKDQIARFFDSLLLGYPIGSFLFWKVAKETLAEFKWYGFVRDYHELNAPHCPVLDVPQGNALVAILDGQQRLTSLNVGLRGSRSDRLSGKHRKNPASYPVQRLYLNLCEKAPENELGMSYDFRFFPDGAVPDGGTEAHWFQVGKVMDLADAPKIFLYIQENGLANHPEAFHWLNRLHEMVHKEKTINFYEEEDQDLEKVLNIFIRVNSGGTVLSYSDLLLSIATAQWSEIDAREAIHGLVDELNEYGQGFAFTKNVVLKAGLVLIGVSDVGFKVTNFNHANMAKLEKNWARISDALRLAAGILADIGLSAATLAAESVLIPVAFYVYHRQLNENYRTAGKYMDDRRALRRWIVGTLVKPGIWGSGLDTLLRNIRTEIIDSSANSFPVAEIRGTMLRQGKSLGFNDEELQDLVETPYKNRRVFTTLSLLFPGVDVRNVFHVDHVFPRSKFTRKRLAESGIPESKIDEYMQRVEGLPNLQLLEGPINVEKQAQMPMEWARARFGDDLNQYLLAHDLQGLPESLDDFLDFWDQRKQKFAAKLATLLGDETDHDGQDND
jgi:hypothetical protein